MFWHINRTVSFKVTLVTCYFALQLMHTRECPPVDLLIRTSGEQRLSDFLLWHSSRTISFKVTLVTCCFCLAADAHTGVPAGGPADPYLWRAAALRLPFLAQ
jgi:hypothetical protein